MVPLPPVRCLHWEPNKHTFQTKKKKFHSNNHRIHRSSDTIFADRRTSGSWIWCGKLKSRTARHLFPFQPHMSMLAAAHFSQTSPLSFPFKGTGLVWQRLIATTSCVTLSHCHTRLQNEYILPPHRCAVSASFLTACKHGSAHGSLFRSKRRHWRVSGFQCGPVIWH